MQISTTGLQISGTDYTWQQTWRFFLVGCLWCIAGSLPPVVWTLYHNYTTYADPPDKTLLVGLVVSAVGPSLTAYYMQHKALLKMPPWFVIPAEFHPEIRKTRVEEHGPHTTETIATGTGTGDGTVVKKESEHETKVTTETVMQLKPNIEPINPPDKPDK